MNRACCGRQACGEGMMGNILLFVFLQLIIAKAYSCSCAYSDGELEDQVREAFESASSVVLAKVETIEKLEPFQYSQDDDSSEQRTFYYRHKTHFSEVQSWKGKHGKQFYTNIVVACCMCGYTFEEGRVYLLYLYGPDEQGFYSTSSCSRTTRLSEELKPELEILNSLL